LGTFALSWRDLLVIVRRSSPGSDLARELNGGEPPWGVTDYLLAAVVDLLANANWQRQGKKSAPKPRPIKRPGQTVEGQKYGSKPIAIRDFDAWWDNPER
jgi:hypothetical protein